MFTEVVILLGELSMKKIFVVLLFVLLTNIVHAQIQITENTSDPQTIAIIASIQQDVKQIQIRLNETTTKQDVDSSFQQLDQKVSSVNQSNSLNSLAFLIGAILMNDIIVLGLIIYAKTKGVLP